MHDVITGIAVQIQIQLILIEFSRQKEDAAAGAAACASELTDGSERRGQDGLVVRLTASATTPSACRERHKHDNC
jgi:hypothetical protein